MGGLFSDRSKKETPGRRRRSRGPRFEPCSLDLDECALFIEEGKAYIAPLAAADKPNEQQLQELLERALAEAAVSSALEAAVRSALEAADGDETLAIKMLRFAEGAQAGNDTNTKLWQPDEQQVQKLVEMGFVEAAVRSALEAVNGDEILAIKMLRFAERARAGNYTNTKDGALIIRKPRAIFCSLLPGMEARHRACLI